MAVTRTRLARNRRRDIEMEDVVVGRGVPTHRSGPRVLPLAARKLAFDFEGESASPASQVKVSSVTRHAAWKAVSVRLAAASTVSSLSLMSLPVGLGDFRRAFCHPYRCRGDPRVYATAHRQLYRYSCWDVSAISPGQPDQTGNASCRAGARACRSARPAPPARSRRCASTRCRRGHLEPAVRIAGCARRSCSWTSIPGSEGCLCPRTPRRDPDRERTACL